MKTSSLLRKNLCKSFILQLRPYYHQESRIYQQKKFAKIELNKNIKAFIMHVTSSSLIKLIILIYLVKKAQIALLIAKKVKISVKYLDIFLKKKVLILLKMTKLNEYAIKL